MQDCWGDLQAWKTLGASLHHARVAFERCWDPGQPLGVTGGSQLHRPYRRDPRPAVALSCMCRRVLLIEDSSHFQNLVTMLVKQKFPAVDLHVANDGITGLVSFGHLQPDLIIVDILLPGIDGATMITGLRRHALFGSCKLVVLTSLDDDQRAPYAFALQGVDHVVHKLKLISELPPLIDKALAHLVRAVRDGRGRVEPGA